MASAKVAWTERGWRSRIAGLLSCDYLNFLALTLPWTIDLLHVWSRVDGRTN